MNKIPPVSSSSVSHPAQPAVYRKVLTINGRGCFLVYKGLHFTFSADKAKPYYSALKNGRLEFAAFPDRLLLKENKPDGGINIIGEVQIDNAGFLCREGNKISDLNGFIRLGSRGRYVSAETLFPAYGQTKFKMQREGEIDPQSGELLLWEIPFVFDLTEGDRYYPDYQAGRLAYKIRQKQAEIFIADEEYLGTLVMIAKGEFLSLNAGRYRVRKKPVKISQLLPQFKINNFSDRNVSEIIENSEFGILNKLVSHRGYKNQLKMVALAAGYYFNQNSSSDDTALKLLYVLSLGIAQLIHDEMISRDLKWVFAGEIMALFESALEQDPQRTRKDTFQIQTAHAQHAFEAIVRQRVA